jgi:HK97 family phage prohead protease
VSEPTILYRAVAGQDIAVDGDGRTVTLRLLSYGTDYTVSDDGVHAYTERWRDGAFRRSLRHGRGEGLPLQWEHAPGMPRTLPVGGSTRVWEETDGSLRLEGRVSRTQFGEDLLVLLQDRVVRGASIEARVFRSTPVVGGFVREEAALRAVAFTCAPQYADAGVLAMRSDAEASGTPRLDALRSRMANLFTAAPEPT